MTTIIGAIFHNAGAGQLGVIQHEEVVAMDVYNVREKVYTCIHPSEALGSLAILLGDLAHPSRHAQSALLSMCTKNWSNSFENNVLELLRCERALLIPRRIPSACHCLLVAPFLQSY